MTTCVTRRSTTRLASASASVRSRPCSRPISSSMASVAIGRCLVEILVESERDPGSLEPRDGCRQLHVVAHGQRELGAFDGTLDRRAARPHRLPACRGRPRRRTARRPRKSAGRASPLRRAPGSRCCRPSAAADASDAFPRSGGGMPITPRNGRSDTSRPCWSRAVPAAASIVHSSIRSSRSPTPSRSLKSVCHPPAVVTPNGADVEPVDPHLEHPAGLRPANLDRADQGVAAVELGVTRLEPLAGRQVPAGVRAGKRDRVARVDRQHGLEIAGEVTVQRPPFERDLVEHDQNSSRRRTASSTRATDGM